MPNGKPYPDHYRCDQCGLLFVIDFSPTVMCAARTEDGDHHCHIGEKLLCEDGSIQWAVASPSCLPFATTEWVE